MAHRWIVSIVFVVIVIVLSITPGTATSNDTVFVWLVVNTATPLQKTMHVVLYALLVLCWLWTLQSIGSNAKRMLLPASVAIVLGAALEWFQTMIPGRVGTLTDILLNTAGVLVGVIVAVVMGRLRVRRKVAKT